MHTLLEILVWIYAPLFILLGVVAWLAALVELGDRIFKNNKPEETEGDSYHESFN